MAGDLHRLVVDRGRDIGEVPVIREYVWCLRGVRVRGVPAVEGLVIEWVGWVVRGGNSGAVRGWEGDGEVPEGSSGSQGSLVLL